jgi:hypothetical protein
MEYRPSASHDGPPRPAIFNKLPVSKTKFARGEELELDIEAREFEFEFDELD